MQTFDNIREQVGKWNVENFGDSNGLGSLAPLMGMVEEFGELIESDGKKEDEHDAIGDITIYLCDYCYREGVKIPTCIDMTGRICCERPGVGIAIYLGRLYHCELKRRQRIRGMDNDAMFLPARMSALEGLVWHLDEAARLCTKRSLLEVLNETWNNIVKKRNWKTDPETGGGHTHNDHGPEWEGYKNNEPV